MNCFNIRELQGNLKRRFFSDLVNVSDHRDFLDSTMIGLRFKTNNDLNIYHDTLSFHMLGTTNQDKSRTSSFINLYDNSPSLSLMSVFNSTISIKSIVESINTWFINSLSIFFGLGLSISPASLLTMFSTNSVFQLLTTLTYNLPLGGLIFSSNAQPNSYSAPMNNAVTFESNNVLLKMKIYTPS